MTVEDCRDGIIKPGAAGRLVQIAEIGCGFVQRCCGGLVHFVRGVQRRNQSGFDLFGLIVHLGLEEQICQSLAAAESRSCDVTGIRDPHPACKCIVDDAEDCRTCRSERGRGFGERITFGENCCDDTVSGQPVCESPRRCSRCTVTLPMLQDIVDICVHRLQGLTEGAVVVRDGRCGRFEYSRIPLPYLRYRRHSEPVPVTTQLTAEQLLSLFV